MVYILLSRLPKNNVTARNEAVSYCDLSAGVCLSEPVCVRTRTGRYSRRQVPAQAEEIASAEVRRLAMTWVSSYLQRQASSERLKDMLLEYKSMLKIVVDICRQQVESVTREILGGIQESTAKSQIFNAKAQSRQDLKKILHFYAFLWQKTALFASWRLCVKVFCFCSGGVQ